MKKRIACFHLLNDYSGSPIVLRMVLQGLLERGWCVDLISSRGGVLDDLEQMEGCKKKSYAYHFSKSAIVTLLRYVFAQLYTMFLAFGYIGKKGTVFYINTILPVGPALAGWMMRKHVVYHYHENARAKSTMYKVLAWIMEHIADEIICVSGYQASQLNRKDHVTVVPNALSREFKEKTTHDIDKAFAEQRVLMLSSLKVYKGTREFISLAHRMPHIQFSLVLNATEEGIKWYMESEHLTLPANLQLYPRHEDVRPFYDHSSMLVNLTKKEMVIETFGLTALEAMTAGLPVIVPTVGGIAEMVENGVNGYKIDVEDIDKIEQTIERILGDKALYTQLAQAALDYSNQFDEKKMVEAIEEKLTQKYE